MRYVLILIAMVEMAHADGYPRDPGPCEDVAACEQACGKGKAAACTWGGVLAAQSAADETMKAKATSLFEKACTKGSTESCWFAARSLGEDPKANKLYDKACSKKHIRACFVLAVRNSAGDAKAQKASTVMFTKLIAMLDTKCDAKDAFACDKLVDIYQMRAAATRDRACVARTGQPCAAPVAPSRPATKKRDPFTKAE
jgi:TPR repeat protein